MKYRKLGATGFDVSEIGLGCWQLGADWGTSISDDDAYEILQTAFDQGIRFFDTADVYGNGISEKRIGQFIKESGHNVKIATKFGRSGQVFPDNYSEKALREAVEGSLKRLETDQIDLLQLHCIPTSILKEGYVFDWLRKLKDEGLIKAFGASVETVDEGLFCIQQEGIQSLQVIFNIFRQKLIPELLPKALEKGVGIIVRLPLASGVLTGKFSNNTVFAESDHRNYNRNGEAFNVGETFAGIPFEKGVQLSGQIKSQFVPAEMTMVQLALRWILDHEAVSSIIPGASSAKQVISNSQVSSISKLSPQLHQKLNDFYQTDIQQYIRGKY